MNNFRYTGREWDPETSLYYYRARYYDPASGRFLSEDPVGFRGRDINLYRYGRNQPGRFTDPIGLFTIDPTFNMDCLPALKRAINIVRNLPKKCDCAFKNIGSHRSLKQLVDDPNIALHFDPNPPDADLHEDAYTNDGDTHNIWIHALPCRMGRWSLASVLVHELVHITLVPGPNQDDPNGPAYGMQKACGLLPLSTEVPVVSPGFPPIETQSAPLPDKLVEP